MQTRLEILSALARLRNESLHSCGSPSRCGWQTGISVSGYISLRAMQLSSRPVTARGATRPRIGILPWIRKQMLCAPTRGRIETAPVPEIIVIGVAFVYRPVRFQASKKSFPVNRIVLASITSAPGRNPASWVNAWRLVYSIWNVTGPEIR